MAGFGEAVQDFHRGIGLGIGLVDDPEWRFGAGDQQQCGPHIFRLRHLVLHLVPDAEAGQRRLAIDTGRHGIGIGHGELLLAKFLRQRKAWCDLQRGRAVLRRDQHDRVAEQVDAASVCQQPAFST